MHNPTIHTHAIKEITSCKTQCKVGATLTVCKHQCITCSGSLLRGVEMCKDLQRCAIGAPASSVCCVQHGVNDTCNNVCNSVCNIYSTMCNVDNASVYDLYDMISMCADEGESDKGKGSAAQQEPQKHACICVRAELERNACWHELATTPCHSSLTSFIPGIISLELTLHCNDPVLLLTDLIPNITLASLTLQ
eukprot:scaffold70314_cov25-Tisochrysis_lutea.AAC.1